MFNVYKPKPNYYALQHFLSDTGISVAGGDVILIVNALLLYYKILLWCFIIILNYCFTYIIK